MTKRKGPREGERREVKLLLFSVGIELVDYHVCNDAGVCFLFWMRKLPLHTQDVDIHHLPPAPPTYKKFA